MSDDSKLQLVLDNSALLLGIAVSVATIVTVVQAHRARSRERTAILRRIDVEYSRVVTVAGALSNRAQQVGSGYARSAGEYWASPSKEEDSLPESIERDVEWLIVRTNQVLSYKVPLEHLSPLLSAPHLDAVAEFARVHSRYVEVVGTRAADLDVYRRKKGVLVRFCSVVTLHGDQLREAHEVLRTTLGLASGPSS